MKDILSVEHDLYAYLMCGEVELPAGDYRIGPAERDGEDSVELSRLDQPWESTVLPSEALERLEALRLVSLGTWQ